MSGMELDRVDTLGESTVEFQTEYEFRAESSELKGHKSVVAKRLKGSRKRMHGVLHRLGIWAEGTSIHALPFLFKENLTNWKRALWAVVVIGVTAMAMWQAVQLVDLYNSNPYNLVGEFNFKNQEALPTLTLCPMAPYNQLHIANWLALNGEVHDPYELKRSNLSMFERANVTDDDVLFPLDVQSQVYDPKFEEEWRADCYACGTLGLDKCVRESCWDHGASDWAREHENGDASCATLTSLDTCLQTNCSSSKNVKILECHKTNVCKYGKCSDAVYDASLYPMEKLVRNHFRQIIPFTCSYKGDVLGLLGTFRDPRAGKPECNVTWVRTIYGDCIEVKGNSPVTQAGQRLQLTGLQATLLQEYTEIELQTFTQPGGMRLFVHPEAEDIGPATKFTDIQQGKVTSVTLTKTEFRLLEAPFQSACEPDAPTVTSCIARCRKDVAVELCGCRLHGDEDKEGQLRLCDTTDVQGKCFNTYVSPPPGFDPTSTESFMEHCPLTVQLFSDACEIPKDDDDLDSTARRKRGGKAKLLDKFPILEAVRRKRQGGKNNTPAGETQQCSIDEICAEMYTTACGLITEVVSPIYGSTGTPISEFRMALCPNYLVPGCDKRCVGSAAGTNCDCPVPCYLEEFELSQSSRDFTNGAHPELYGEIGIGHTLGLNPEDVRLNSSRATKAAFSLDVGYETLLVQSLSQEPAYNTFSFLSALGGLFGFWTGYSVVSMVEVVDLVALRILPYLLCHYPKKEGIGSLD